MADILFIVTVLSLLFFIIRIIIRFIRKKPILKNVRIASLIATTYTIVWIMFYLLRKDIPVALGTNVCFDDWCATITKYEKITDSEFGDNAQEQYLILHVKMTNNAKRVSQKPSEPKVYLKDKANCLYTTSNKEQKLLELKRGKQIALDVRLDLHQSKETQLLFIVPKQAKQLEAIIDEGPLITKFLLQFDRSIYILN